MLIFWSVAHGSNVALAGKMAGCPFCIMGYLLHTLMVIICSLMVSSDTYHALTWQR